MKDKVPLSVAIITKNEEERLPECLKSISFADDIIVVDSGSTDRTCEIARKFLCKVFIEEWKGYGPQKNSAVQKCRNEWVLIIDADERVPEETRQKIVGILKNPACDAYSFKRKNFLHGRWIKHCGWWPDRVIRLVKKDRGKFYNTVHERWVTDGKIGYLDENIEHYSYSNYPDLIRKLNHYSTIKATELFISGRKANPFSPVFHGITMFLRTYLLKRGFLDGMDGLVIALTIGGGSFFKYAKLLELQRHK